MDVLRHGPDAAPALAVQPDSEAPADPTTDPPPFGDAAPAAVEAGPRRRRRGFGPAFWLAVGWLAVVLVCALAASLLPVQDPLVPDVRNKLALPSAAHLLGTDGLGRDTLSRLVHGAQVSVTISLTAVAIGMLVGGSLGIVVGFFRGRVETVVMTAVNVVLAFPALVLLLVLLAFVGRSLLVISLVVGFLSVPIYTRVARANTLAVAQREFVRAARTMGARNGRVLVREILPNVVLPVAAFGLVAMGVVIVLEGTLAFLGLSVEQPAPTWGGMIFDGKRYLSEAPYVVAIPSLVMFLTVLSLNFVGDGLRSRFDVRGSNL